MFQKKWVLDYSLNNISLLCRFILEKRRKYKLTLLGFTVRLPAPLSLYKKSIPSLNSENIGKTLTENN